MPKDEKVNVIEELADAADDLCELDYANSPRSAVDDAELRLKGAVSAAVGELKRLTEKIKAREKAVADAERDREKRAREKAKRAAER